VLAVASQAEIPVTHYSPNEVKLAIAGAGGADKAQVQNMVARVLRLDARPEPPDAADALALALCHAWGAPLRHAVGAAVTPGANGLGAAIERALAREDAS
jgi:crossover junction endodeoxyribonuclease RuvC